MRITKVLMAFLIGLFLLVSVNFAQSQCSPVVDQQQNTWTLECFSYIGQQQCYENHNVQSFQPSYDNVTGVEVRLSQGPGLTFKIGLFDSLPNTGATPLAEATITAQGGGTAEYVTANWGRVPVTPGQTYYFGYCWVGGSQNCLAGASGNPYLNGQLYGFGDFDLTFKTFSDPCSVINVDIDIKPGSFPNSINLCSQGSTPVAIFGSANFDVTQVQNNSLTLADSAVKIVGKSSQYLCHDEYVNADGYLDRVCQFYTIDLTLDATIDTSAKLNGNLLDGTPIVGTDSVKLVKDCP